VAPAFNVHAGCAVARIVLYMLYKRAVNSNPSQTASVRAAVRGKGESTLVPQNSAFEWE